MEDGDRVDAWQFTLEERLESLDILLLEHFASCMENGRDQCMRIAPLTACISQINLIPCRCLGCQHRPHQRSESESAGRLVVL